MSHVISLHALEALTTTVPQARLVLQPGTTQSFGHLTQDAYASPIPCSARFTFKEPSFVTTPQRTGSDGQHWAGRRSLLVGVHTAHEHLRP
jgi:hypothetical protein